MAARVSGPVNRLSIGTALGIGIVLSGCADAGVPAMEPTAYETSGQMPQPMCRSRSDCGPWLMGGLQITFTGWLCTVGFVARDMATRDLYILTAGHCVAGSGVSALWSHHGAAIGRATAEAFHPGSNADVGEIEVAQSDAGDEIYGLSNTDIRNVTGWAPNASQTVGSKICRSGGTSGWRCGSIAVADVDATIEGRLIHHTWLTDFPSAAGDSGSPVLDGDGRAAGIVIATTATQTLYSTVEWIATELGVRPCRRANCDCSRQLSAVTCLP
jgi:hypothetical protein